MYRKIREISYESASTDGRSVSYGAMCKTNGSENQTKQKSQKKYDQPTYYLPEGVQELIEAYYFSSDYYKSHFPPSITHLPPEYMIARTGAILSYVTRHKLRHFEQHKYSKNLEYNAYSGCPINIQTMNGIIGGKYSSGIINGILIRDLGILEVVSCEKVGETSRMYDFVNPTSRIDQLLPKQDCVEYFLTITANTKKHNDSLKSSIPAEYQNQLESFSIHGYEEAAEQINLLNSIFETKEQEREYIINKLTAIGKLDSDELGPYISDKSIDLASMISEDYKNKQFDLYVETRLMIKKTTGIYSYLELSLNEIQNKVKICTRPVSGSRVYARYNTLKTEYRRLARVNGETTVELDIANSQPLLACALIMEWSVKKYGVIKEDILKMKDLCEKGEFYNAFKYLSQANVRSYTKLKANVFGTFFSEVRPENQMSKYDKAFFDLFPTAYEAVSDIKGGVGSSSFNQFAINLQKLEASIMFDSATVKMLEMRRFAFCGFDSIITVKADAEAAKKCIMNAFEKRGIKPLIREIEHKDGVSVKDVINEMLINDFNNYEAPKPKRSEFSDYKIKNGKYKGRYVTSLSATEELDYCKWFTSKSSTGSNKSANKKKKKTNDYRAMYWWLVESRKESQFNYTSSLSIFKR